MEAINAADCLELLGFEPSFLPILLYSCVLMREPSDYFAIYASKGPYIDILFDIQLCPCRYDVWSRGFWSSCGLSSAQSTNLSSALGFEPYVRVPYVSLAAESSLNKGLLLLKWLMPRSASLNCHSCGFLAPLLTTRRFSGLTSWCHLLPGH